MKRASPFKLPAALDYVSQISSRRILMAPAPGNPSEPGTFVGYPETRAFLPFRKRYVATGPTVTKLDFHGTVKIHGCNISLHFSEPEKWRIQSRHRILSAKEDQYDVYAKLNGAPWGTVIQEILRIHGANIWEDITIVGEWAGKGIQRKVGVCTLDRFLTIFNIRIGKYWQDIRKYSAISLLAHRVFNICDFPTYPLTIDLADTAAIDDVEKQMIEMVEKIDKECPVAAHFGVNGPGEGLVFTYHPPEPSFDLYNFKVKGESHAVVKTDRVQKVPTEKAERIRAFVEYSVTEARLDQGLEYLKEMLIPVEAGSTGKYIKWVVQDVLKEEGDKLEEMELNEPDIKFSLTKAVRMGWTARLREAELSVAFERWPGIL
jgi:RNA ligase